MRQKEGGGDRRGEGDLGSARSMSLPALYSVRSGPRTRTIERRRLNHTVWQTITHPHTYIHRERNRDKTCMALEMLACLHAAGVVPASPARLSSTPLSLLRSLANGALALFDSLLVLAHVCPMSPMATPDTFRSYKTARGDIGRRGDLLLGNVDAGDGECGWLAACADGRVKILLLAHEEEV